MTSIFFDPALFGAPSEPEPTEQLIVNGRYMLPPIGDPTGKRRSLQRVTNFIKQLSDQGALMKWKPRMAVIGLARDERLYDLACSIDPSTPRGRQELDELVEQAVEMGQAGPSGGAMTGTALHNLTDNVGHEPTRVRAKWAPKVENYQRALRDKGLRTVAGLSERLVVSERYGTCGRLDDVYEDPFGVLRVGDRKSQKEFYTWWEIGAQLALYQSSEAMWNEQESRWEDMPKLADDYAHVAWMPLNHPAGLRGGDVDTVTIYDLPLEAPREVLEWCARVRTLRTGARSWGKERQLDDFARIARDIRDAESHDDLRRLAAEIPALSFEGDPLNRMAAKRWEELVVPDPGPDMPGARSIGNLADAAPVDDFECRYDGRRVSEHPINQPGVYACISPERRLVAPLSEITGPLSGDPTTRALQYALTEKMTQDVVRLDAPAMERLPSLADYPLLPATSPAGQQARLMIDAKETSLEELAAQDWQRFAAMFVGPEQYTQAVEPLPNPLAAATQEERQALVAQQWADGEGALRKPLEWATHLKLGEDFRVIADADGVWCKPMPLKTFRYVYAKEVALAELAKIEGTSGVRAEADRTQAHPIAVANFTHSRHEDATVVELPSQSDVDEASGPGGLATVPIKVVKEIAVRAGNSGTARGRVRLLNDIDTNKPSLLRHADVLVPAVLAEWLERDGGPVEDPAGGHWVANTGGSKRAPMRADQAGTVTLSAYLASKEAPKSSVDGESEASSAEVRGDDAVADEVQLKDSVDISRAVTPPEGAAQNIHFDRNDDAVIPDGTLAGDRERLVPGTTHQVRQKYLNLMEGPQAGKHSVARLIELAKEARDGHERAKVFHAISKYHKWTGAIAAEINQHYLDNGYDTVDFDPYFEAKVIEGPAVVLAPDDPSTAEDAVHLLDGAANFGAFQDVWQQLSSKPFWTERAVQEAVMRNMVRLK